MSCGIIGFRLAISREETEQKRRAGDVGRRCVSMLTHSTCKLGGEDGSLRSTTTINS